MCKNQVSMLGGSAGGNGRVFSFFYISYLSITFI
jgi:hypothetical protein